MKWRQINEIFPVNSVGIVTSRDNFVISFDKRELKNRILQFQNFSQADEIILRAFNLKEKSNWKIDKARNEIAKISYVDENIMEILYRPFDKRYIFYHQAVIERMRNEVMRHMLKENIGLITIRRSRSSDKWNFAFVSDKLISGATSITSLDINYLFPLYLYPEKRGKKSNPISTMLIFEPEAEYYARKVNINEKIFKTLSDTINEVPSPETILYYTYGILYSNVYREKYAEFLKIDFPRIPFTANYELFKKMGDLGKQLADLHLLKSPAIDQPIAKYQGSGTNDRIDEIIYIEDEQRIYINKDKYFEGVAPEVWNYHIGGYQVLQKYLKERKGRNIDDAPHFCRIVTALSKTIEIQKQIDEIYPEVEKELIQSLPQS